MNAKVFVGLSGGVDSAVSAALLKERGFEVVGVFIKIWRPEFIECTWKEDRLDAIRVCTALGIPFREIDLSAEYKKDVVDSMLRDYAVGITPNPDVLCNRSIKFGAFAKWARTQRADFIATGHYARIRQAGGHFELLRGVDAEKDQSYFLYRLGQADLARTLFPVGGMRKAQVRAKAKHFNLPVAQKHDSQGLCFVGDVSMPDFLRRFINVEPGAVVDLSGRAVGQHEGAALYTVGERHGFTTSHAQAHYVVDVDTQKNILTVSPDRAHAAHTQALLSDVHWVHHAPPSGTSVQVQARYREQPVRAQLKSTAYGVRLACDEPHLFPPGQSAVVYQGEVCLGGGSIQKEVLSDALARSFSPQAPVKKIVRRVQ